MLAPILIGGGSRKEPTSLTRWRSLSTKRNWRYITHKKQPQLQVEVGADD